MTKADRTKADHGKRQPWFPDQMIVWVKRRRQADAAPPPEGGAAGGAAPTDAGTAPAEEETKP